jgi:hypothetical protein
MRSIDFTRINVLFVLGLLLAIGGCNSIFLFRGDLIYISLMFYVLGLLLVWWSGTGTFNKLLAFLLPAVVFITVYTVSQDVRVRESEVWLIPAGYTGPIYVFLGEKCGEEAQFEEEGREYRFSREGILYSRHKKNFGLTVEPERFYYVNEQGVRRSIPLLQSDRPPGTDADTLPVLAFPGLPLKGEADIGRFSLQYAFIGTTRDFTAHIQGSTLPEAVPADLLLSWEAHRQACR